MDSHLFRAFAALACPLLIGARIEKIQSPAPDMLTIACFGQQRKFQLVARFGKHNPFFFISGSRLPAAGPPSAQVMRLRKYFGQKRIGAAVGQFCQRKLWLMASGATAPQGTAAWLCLDLLKGFTLQFLTPDSAPHADAPAWPAREEVAQALQDWRAWPILTPLLRKTLASLETGEQLALLEDLRIGGGDLFFYRGNSPDESRISIASAWPLPPELRKNLVEETATPVLESLERAGKDIVLGGLADSQAHSLLMPIKKRVKKLDGLIAKLAQDESRLKALAAQRPYGEAIAANLWRLDGQAHLDLLALDPDSPGLELNRKYTVRENMERFFHNALRGRRGLDQLARRRQELELERAALLNPAGIASANTSSDADSQPQAAPTLLTAVQKRLPSNVAASLSSDGHIFLRGKDARGNLAARRHAQPTDLWVHVQNGPGAHVIIRKRHAGEDVPAPTLEEAGALAASKSWLSQAAQADVMIAEVRHVKPIRGAGAGMVSVDRILKTITVRLPAQ